MDSLILEIAIGLTVLYYVSATLVSAVAEGITRLLNTRSKILWAALARLVTGENASLGAPRMLKALVPTSRERRSDAAEHERDVRPSVTSTQILVDAAAQDGDAQPKPVEGRLAELALSPSIRSLDYVTGGKTKVSNIPGTVFASAILELATIKSNGASVQERLGDLADEYSDAPLGAFLKARILPLGSDVDRITDEVGAWFDGQMKRLTETYRKNMKYVLAIIGLILALACNLDTLGVATALHNDAKTRAVVMATADDISKDDLTENCDSTASDPTQKVLECGAQKLSDFSTIGVAIPFSDNYISQLTDSWGDGSNHLSHGLGIALTVGAMALGGPMWFDFLMLLTGRKRT